MTEPKKVNKRVFERTIELELHEQWIKNQRRNDVTQMAKELGYSVPVINRALKQGYVASPELPGAITNWFLKRIAAEQKQAAELSSHSK